MLDDARKKEVQELMAVIGRQGPCRQPAACHGIGRAKTRSPDQHGQPYRRP